MLSCKDLTKQYNGITVVDHLTFQIKKGEVFALLGTNGAGKTTTIKMILELVEKNGGQIEKYGEYTIGYSPETPYFPPFLTAREVLSYYGRIQGLDKRDLKKDIATLLQLVGLEDNRTKVKVYSKGMLQRLALAQALLGDPMLLLLDEPTAGLDALGRVEMIELIGKLKSQGKTIIINSHILNDMERVCDGGIIIKKGKILYTWEKNADHHGKSLEEIFVETVKN
ncbi:MAG: ABC transporter ATP-binding protein [Lachnospiraceae bacterium]|nr:ABC transporter ATP-binding protein [Lachnospiraceae bacterium]